MCLKSSVRWPSVPNFSGQSRKNTRSFGTLNCPEFRTLSRICPDLISRCVAVDQFDIFPVRNAFCWDKTHQIHFRPGLRPGPRWRNLLRSLRLPSRMGRAMPLPPWCLCRLDLGIVATSKSVPNFHHGLIYGHLSQVRCHHKAHWHWRSLLCWRV